MEGANIKRLYILEERKRKYRDRFFPNSVISVIGIFTEPIKAVKWIKKYGKTWREKNNQYFWKLNEITLLNRLNDYTYDFYDNKGDVICI